MTPVYSPFYPVPRTLLAPSTTWTVLLAGANRTPSSRGRPDVRLLTMWSTIARGNIMAMPLSVRPGPLVCTVPLMVRQHLCLPPASRCMLWVHRMEPLSLRPTLLSRRRHLLWPTLFMARNTRRKALAIVPLLPSPQVLRSPRCRLPSPRPPPHSLERPTPPLFPRHPKSSIFIKEASSHGPPLDTVKYSY